MMGPKQEAQAALFYEFSLEDHVPDNHLLRSIDRFVDLGSIRQHLAAFYSHTGRPSVDPELLLRMLLVGYAFALKPLGFVIPTAVAAGILSYQISPRPLAAALSGVGLSLGLFVLFKFALGLSLIGFPKGWF